jgi:two-component system sensor histidine kinase ChiS
MADQVRMRTNDLERLLDLDDSAILCFDSDQEIVFFNRAATVLFGYSNDEFSDIDMTELFTDDVPGLVRDAPGLDGKAESKLHTPLGCKHKDGHRFQCNGVINPIDVMGQTGHAIALNTLIGEAHTLSGQSEQRLEAVEQSLSSLLQFARSNPSLMLDLGNIVDLSADGKDALTDKALIREQAVHVMNLALACWERQLGRSKLDLAEESGLWPVYIDKSTPTTRTLDKYLNLELCPKNPRSKRVIDTAEFVLRKVDDESSSACEQLQSELDSFRKRVSGISKQAPKSA